MKPKGEIANCYVHFKKKIESLYYFCISGTCLYFSSAHSDVDVYDCQNFEDGCPSSHYLSSEIYKCERVDV